MAPLFTEISQFTPLRYFIINGLQAVQINSRTPEFALTGWGSPPKTPFTEADALLHFSFGSASQFNPG